MNLQKAGSLCAFYSAIAYIVGFIVLFAFFDPGRLATLDTLQKVQLYLEHQTLLYYWNILIYIGFGITLIVLVLALDKKISANNTSLASIGKIFGLIWSALVIASGMVANLGLAKVSALINESTETALSVWHTISVIQEAFGGGVEIVGGLWVLAVSTIGYSSGKLPKWLNILGLIIGACGLLTVLPPLKALGALFGLGQIPWFVAIGVSLWRSSRSEASV